MQHPESDRVDNGKRLFLGACSPRSGNGGVTGAPALPDALPGRTELALPEVREWVLLLQQIKADCLDPWSRQLAGEMRSHHEKVLRAVEAIRPQNGSLESMSTEVAAVGESVADLRLDVKRIEERLEALCQFGGRPMFRAGRATCAPGRTTMAVRPAPGGGFAPLPVVPGPPVTRSNSDGEVRRDRSRDTAAQDRLPEDIEISNAVNARPSRAAKIKPRPVELNDLEQLAADLQAARGWTRGAYGKSMVELTKGQSFLDRASMVLVAIHFMYMGYNVNTRMGHALDDEKAPKLLTGFDATFGFLFAIEILVRLKLHRQDFWRGPDRFWNLFDTFLVVSGWLEVAFAGLNVGFMRSLRLLRLMRLTRVLRFVRFVRELRVMLASIMCCLVSLGWAFFLLVIIIYMFSLFIMQLLVQELELGSSTPTNAALYYGSLGKMILSLYMVISGGINWNEVAKPLTSLSDWYALPFCAFSAFTMFGVLNVLTAVFVQSATRIADHDQDLVVQETMANEGSTMNALKEILLSACEGCEKGFISTAIMEELLVDPVTVAHLRVLGLSVTEARGIFNLLDLDDRDLVLIDELVLNLMRLTGEAKQLDVQTLMYENKKLSMRLTGFMRWMEDVVAAGDDSFGGMQDYMAPMNGRDAMRATKAGKPQWDIHAV